MCRLLVSSRNDKPETRCQTATFVVLLVCTTLVIAFCAFSLVTFDFPSDDRYVALRSPVGWLFALLIGLAAAMIAFLSCRITKFEHRLTFRALHLFVTLLCILVDLGVCGYFVFYARECNDLSLRYPLSPNDTSCTAPVPFNPCDVPLLRCLDPAQQFLWTSPDNATRLLASSFCSCASYAFFSNRASPNGTTFDSACSEAKAAVAACGPQTSSWEFASAAFALALVVAASFLNFVLGVHCFEGSACGKCSCPCIGSSSFRDDVETDKDLLRSL